MNELYPLDSTGIAAKYKSEQFVKEAMEHNLLLRLKISSRQRKGSGHKNVTRFLTVLADWILESRHKHGVFAKLQLPEDPGKSALSPEENRLKS
jgi:hypothetical protein